jgi:hypothetical protein
MPPNSFLCVIQYACKELEKGNNIVGRHVPHHLLFIYGRHAF